MKDKILKVYLPALLVILIAVVLYITNKKSQNQESIDINKEQTEQTEDKNDTSSYKGFSESVYVTNAEKSIQNKDYATAKKIIEEALAFYPKSVQLTSDYIGVLHAMGDIKNAIVYADKLIKIDPSNYSNWKLKAQVVRSTVTTYTDSQKTEVSKIYEDALVATKNNIEIISTYAVFAEDYLTKEKAIELWKLAQKVNPIGAQSYQVIIDRLSK